MYVILKLTLAKFKILTTLYVSNHQFPHYSITYYLSNIK